MQGLFGSCLCEKVTYEIRDKPVSQGICYCKSCQKTGAAYGNPVMVINKNDLICSSENLGSYSSKSARGSVVTRYFCKDCGTHLFADISDLPQFVTLRAATLLDSSEYQPEYLVWTMSAFKGCLLPKDIPQFLENAPPEKLLASQK